MAGCATGSVQWLDEWFALDSATGTQANKWVLPSARWLRTQGYRFARVNLRITVVGSGGVRLDYQTSSNPEAASPITLNGGGSAPSAWANVGAPLSALLRTIQVDDQEISSEGGLRDFLRLQAENTDTALPAQIRLEAWVTLGS